MANRAIIYLFLISRATLNLCLPRPISLSAIYITVNVKIQIRLYFVICYLIMHIVHNMCQSPTSAALAVSCVFHIKLF